MRLACIDFPIFVCLIRVSSNLVSEQGDTMAPTQMQRVEQLEQDFAGLHATLNEVMMNQQTMGEKLSRGNELVGSAFGRADGTN